MGQPYLFCLCLAVCDPLPLDQTKSQASRTLNAPPPAPSARRHHHHFKAFLCTIQQKVTEPG